MIVIGDIHGCYKTFLALLKQLPKDDIYIVGDLIDRGPRSNEVIQYLIDNPEIKSVLGNHEEMMLDYLKDPNVNWWLMNGANTTKRSYNNNIPLDHIDFLSQLPLSIEVDNVIISHSGNPDDTWDRGNFPLCEGDSNKIYIHGHTPIPKDQIVIGPNWVNIDTGCVFKHLDEHGVLSAVQYPEMNFFSQDNID